MTSEAVLEWRNYRYFPYEREFARMEVERLFHAEPRSDDLGLRVPNRSFNSAAATRLTYVARAVSSGGAVVVPAQTLLEASASDGRRERQATRYSAHGLHEYKGKFNPQVVRAIGNIIGLDEDANVLDPFCGSGTTLLECAHVGWSAAGFDRNPLAVWIANAKVQALRMRPETLETLSQAVVAEVKEHAAQLEMGNVTDSRIAKVLGASWMRNLPEFPYLESWFPRAVLAQVVAIRRAIAKHAPDPASRAPLEVILSDLLRDSSYQDPADLRIRRRKDPEANYPISSAFVDAMKKRLACVVRARQAMSKMRGKQEAHLADSRALTRPRKLFDAVITSPPYETALPYVDTQRLSLVLFGFVAASDIQRAEKRLIGARDIATSERKKLELAIGEGNALVPHAVRQLCLELLSAAALPGNGFRRVSKPALTWRYFLDMAGVFASLRRVVRPGGKVAMVVGHNRTTLGGKEFLIETPKLLSLLAQHHGFVSEVECAMETYQRFDLHRKNSIDCETLLVLRA